MRNLFIVPIYRVGYLWLVAYVLVVLGLLANAWAFQLGAVILLLMAFLNEAHYSSEIEEFVTDHEVL
jgi:hypothetical protein